MHGDNGKKRVHFIGKQNREIAEQFRFIEHGHFLTWSICPHLSDRLLSFFKVFFILKNIKKIFFFIFYDLLLISLSENKKN
jgi:hypothetical protein